MPLEINDSAPDFYLPSTSGSVFSPQKNAKGKAMLIYFYPKDFTAGCTSEACVFRDAHPFFKELQIPVIGISRDSLETHLKFKTANKLPYELLSDHAGQVAKLYKATIPVLGITKRVTYLFDKNHRLAALFDNFYDTDYHIKSIVKAVSELGK